jgi:gamma-glutamyl-gamma-aminobutyrate hydrolase PuuD
MSAPVIGITAHVALVRDIDDDPAEVGLLHHVVAVAYVKAVARGGGVPMIVPIVTADRASIDAALDHVDALVVTGGCDIDPASYGAARDPQLGPTSPERDEADLAITRAALARDLPTLAVCRGIQVLNVALGGTLVQHVDDHMRRDQYNESAHTVTVEPGSLLAEIVGTDPLGVNTLHHQVIDRVAAPLHVVARNRDGQVEGVELEGSRSVLGVQWHPELLRHRDDHLALFEWLARTAAATS